MGHSTYAIRRGKKGVYRALRVEKRGKKKKGGRGKVCSFPVPKRESLKTGYPAPATKGQAASESEFEKGKKKRKRKRRSNNQNKRREGKNFLKEREGGKASFPWKNR